MVQLFATFLPFSRGLVSLLWCTHIGPENRRSELNSTLRAKPTNCVGSMTQHEVTTVGVDYCPPEHASQYADREYILHKLGSKDELWNCITGLCLNCTKAGPVI